MMYIIADSEAKLLFVGSEFLQVVESCAPAERHGTTYGLEEPYQGRSFVAWRDARQPLDPQWRLSPEAAAVQLYTSGTTGHPKGAVLTHRNFVTMPQLSATYEWSRWNADAVSCGRRIGRAVRVR